MSYHEDRRESSHEKRGGWGSGGGSGDKWASRLYVGRLSRNVSESDIDDAFGKYGRIREVDQEVPGADRPETAEIQIMVVAEEEGVDSIVGRLKDVLIVVTSGIGLGTG
ncbi:6522_t:CDS:2 [Ambispora gerdemannii]|uniref:6522_t:CDS:1 n=1 Tax=Ambispora gerdemannii TaxID=144530 RepID=A0A9N9AU00_9GLOM|nr:6522_t:CDS:2 [Ambispora gerdemannii]